MLRRFILTLMSSWVVNPLGILVAQWFGVASSPTIILVLLATGACVPFQLLMNECMAASVENGRTAPTPFQILLVLLIQVAACSWVLYIQANQVFDTIQTALTIIALALNTAMSYQIALSYYHLVARDRISLNTAVHIGAIPGVTSLVLYIIFCLLSTRHAQSAVGFIIATAILPSIVQWVYLRRIRAKTPIHSSPRALQLPMPMATTWLISSIFALAILTAASTYFRETLSGLSLSHAALLLVILNSLLSLVNTSTRAAFLSKSGRNIQTTLATMSFMALGLMAIGKSMNWKFNMIFGLLATQFCIAWVIEASRRMPAANA